MEKTEDRTSPVNESEIIQAIRDSDECKLLQLVAKVLGALNEKRDSYNGVVSSMIYLVESEDERIISRLKNGIIEYLTQRPMSFAGKTFLDKALYRLISDQPRFVQDLFEYLIESCDSWKQRILPDEDQVLKIQITALKAIKQAESSKLGRQTILAPELIDRLCMNSISKGDDATKIDTLSLIVESRSTTKILDDKELNIYQSIFIDAICMQDAALRQIFIALTNKLLKRLKDSYKVVLREDKRSIDSCRVTTVTNRYRKFIDWLIETCLDSNYCNAYFGSFVLTLSTLKLIILHITFSEPDLPIGNLLRTNRCYDSVLSCLSDSFEENKVLAVSLILLLPYNEKYYSDSHINTFHSIAYNLVNSISPADSLTCIYMFKLLIRLEDKRSREMNYLIHTKNGFLLRHLRDLTNQVDDSIRCAEYDSTMSLASKPIYPKLTCIRYLLEEAEFSELENHRSSWLVLCHQLVEVLIKACTAVSSIVCNLNPETIGHLPMDLKPVDPESLAKYFNPSISSSISKCDTISSQMLLISGWKTIKECSLSLGTLCAKFWWPKDGIKKKKEKYPCLETEPFLAHDDILKILNYFDHYLRNLRHRGAFEQAYNGFIMVTQRVWHDDMLREVLIKSLYGIMDDFKTSNSISVDRAQQLKAYVTRRSAGLPFVVQAILSSEHKQESKILGSVMNSLFEVLTSENSEEYQRIHCMNILRALIKDHNLGEKVLKYVGETLSIALKAFRSDSFPIRNCANMLLKAVVDRTFGVNRLRDEIHRRNQLSFEKFFSEFPNLYAELMEYLNTDVTEKKYLPSIHSVLIVLSRLKASTSPSANYTFDQVIMPFIAPTMNWTLNCPDYKLREVAAKICIQLCNNSTVQISPPVNMDEVKNYLMRNLSYQSAGSNQSHGRLAATRCLIESDSNLFDQLKDFIWTTLREADRTLSSAPHQSSLELNLVTTLESWCRIVQPKTVRDGQFNLLASLESYIHDAASNRYPHAEQTFFKSVSFALIESLSECTSEPSDNVVLEINEKISQVVFDSSVKNSTLNLQAALIRQLRQLHEPDNDIVDELHSALDLDSTAVHETPFDKLNYRKDQGLECAKLEAYINRSKMAMSSQRAKQIIGLYVEKVIDFSKFDEFKPLQRDGEACDFSIKSSNTPRSIELLAYACKTRGFLDVGRSIIWQHSGETETDKLRSNREFISNLGDCDAKSLAIILAGQMLLQVDLTNCDNITEIESFGRLIYELANVDHGFVVRKACCHFLGLTIGRFIRSNAKISTGILVDFISTIIKLTKDPESELRSIGFKIVSSLDEFVSVPQDGTIDLRRSRLDPLIRLIVDGEIFEPNDVEHMQQVMELLCQIIFDHRDNSSHESEDEEEGLFDKTKLSTFADQVAAIESAFRGLYRFRERLSQQGLNRTFEMRSLKVPSSVMAELKFGLKISEQLKAKSTGDYSWRPEDRPLNLTSTSDDYHKVIDRLLDEILDSLHYFARGYWNILTDTEYIYHELSLYRRLAYLKFVLDHVDRKAYLGPTLNEIEDGLRLIVRDISATTMLTKCLDVLKYDQVTWWLKYQ